ncbi:hypothetical protein [Streptococcus pantholopis]|uniref:Uncharacterized protein n=1 Tax=Streptococcus pantholopis TaxID=1811193 RepID=A0A172Q869_9STRE|nr:hypothetical protein [Streptococcus pantholopis]AND79664.1 hypothetical protein A0O21_06320 [Streptococcus pantholopis]
MISEKNKATRIMKELIGYFLEHRYYQFDVSFQLDKDKFELSITAPSPDIPNHFKHLLRDLNTEREVEIDEYYNALLGGHGTDHDYSLLGRAIDLATLEHKEGMLTLKIYRNIGVS